MNRKNFSLGLSILVVALALAQGAMAFPSQTGACGPGCHTVSTALSISAIGPASTVTPGQSFPVSIIWSGGSTSAATVVKWPSVNDNALFGLDPAVVVSTSASGTAISTLTAPLTEGNYIVTVYISTKSGGLITNFANVPIEVKAAPAPAPDPVPAPAPVPDPVPAPAPVPDPVPAPAPAPDPVPAPGDGDHHDEEHDGDHHDKEHDGDHHRTRSYSPHD